MTSNDADWVEDVRRWYFNSGRSASSAEVKPVLRKSDADAAELGYEAAQPGLQSSGWTKPAGSGFGLLR